MNTDLERKRLAGSIAPALRRGQKPKDPPPDRSLLSGIITPMEKRKKKEKDKFDAIGAESAGVVTGVIAATIATNRVSPLAVLPTEWDVLASPQALIGANFAGFRLPRTNLTIGQYIAGDEDVTYDTECLANTGALDPAKQNLPSVINSNSYALRATAICQQGGLNALAGNNFNGVSGVFPLRWSGPLSNKEQQSWQIGFGVHFVGGQQVSHNLTTWEIPIPSVTSLNSGPFSDFGYATVDLTFLAIDGGPWTVIITRIA